MSEYNYKQNITYNYASSLGAAFRNALTQDVVENGNFKDAESAGERLTSLLKRMQELKQYDQETIVGVVITMLHQMGDLSDVADYCRKNGCSNIETARRAYENYATALKAGNESQISRFASLYNWYLERAGGPENNRGEFYLSAGK